MRITEHIKRAEGKTLFSLELLPPVKGKSINDIYHALDPLMEFKPEFIDVTYHREDYMYKQRADGLLEKLKYRKRPGTVAICAAIMQRYKVDAVPHLICGGFTREGIENILIDLQFLGIDNVLVLRGDARHTDGKFIPEPEGHSYATELLQQVMDMNAGKYLHEDHEGFKTNFCVGVAGYPEKHFEAPNLNTDFSYLKKKVDMGAEFIVTQMFYDVKKYVAFTDKCRQEGINVPIIPGLKPITSKNQLVSLPKIFHIDIPEELSNAVSKAKDNEAVKVIGIEWMTEQCRELMKHNVPVLHFYTMSNPYPTLEIARAIF